MPMTFQLKDFDGPLDLLLTLVTRAQVEIKDIFVSEITDQYIDYVNSAVDLDMEDATDFLVMAATLLEIKSRAMLPRPPALSEGEEDPEQALIRRLEEYKRFRDSTEAMRRFEAAARDMFAKLPEEYPLPPQETEFLGLSLAGLAEALQAVLARVPAREEEPEGNRYAARDIRRDEHTVQECMLTLMHGVRAKGGMRFAEAFGQTPTREEVVTMFLAMLELLRLGQMHIVQEKTYGEIWLHNGPAEEIQEEETPGE